MAKEACRVRNMSLPVVHSYQDLKRAYERVGKISAEAGTSKTIAILGYRQTETVGTYDAVDGSFKYFRNNNVIA